MPKDRFTTPQPGDLLLVYPGSIIQDGIALVEDIEMMRKHIRPPSGRHVYAHVAVYVGNGQVIEALGRGLQKNTSEGYRGCSDVWSYSPMTSNSRRRIVHQAERMLERGYRYSYWDIFILLVRLTTGLRLPWRQMMSVICSVFGYDCWRAAGYQIAQYNNCSPEEIATYGVLEYQGRY